ncbi:hypothetical protein [Streptomyces sp. BBFR109]|uniref:hypothetical protein n=1 Tax=Streptomyces sp. BBFR109 TaxID=3448172 RepID=UPI003F7777DE
MTSNWDEAGCARDCAEQHTYRYGRCALGRPAEPTVSMSYAYTDFDGYVSVGFDTFTVQQLADLVEPALRRVAVRLGPHALAMLQRGEHVGLSGGEYADLARQAAHKIVHRHCDQEDETVPTAATAGTEETGKTGDKHRASAAGEAPTPHAGRPVVTVHGDPGISPAAREALDALADVAVRQMAGPCTQHPHAPVIGGTCGGCTQYPADMCPAPAAEPRCTCAGVGFGNGDCAVHYPPAPAADEEALLCQHVAAEIREADTARAKLAEAQATIRDLTRALRTAEAAIERVRALRQPFPMWRDIAAALDGTEQPTTEDRQPLRVTPCNPPRMAVHCGGECLTITDLAPDTYRTDRIALVGDAITCFTGAPDGSAPALPERAHYIAEVYLPRGTTVITTANINSSGLLFYRPTTTKEN